MTETHSLFDKQLKAKVDAILNKPPDETAREILALERTAHHDTLTGMLNLRGCIKTFNEITNILKETEKELRESGVEIPEGKQLRVVGFRNYDIFLVDLVGLHATNSTFGDAAGDKKLKSLGESLSSFFKRSTDVPCRLQGDEFLVLSANNGSGDKGYARKVFDDLTNNLPEDVKINAVLGRFDSTVNGNDAIMEVREKLKEAKAMGKLDEHRRSAGFGLAFAGDYE